MKSKGHGASRFSSRTWMRFGGIALALALTGFGWLRLAADDQTADGPRRIIVKFNEPLARDIESVLPDTLTLSEPARRVSLPWFQKHPVRLIRPLYGELARQKKTRRVSHQQLTNEVLRRFPGRTRRAPAGAVTPDISRTYVLELAAVSDAELKAAVESLSREPNVEWAERERLVPLSFTPNDPYFSSSGTWGKNYPDLWGVHKSNCPAAWDVANGQGVVVAVVDTGVDWTHSDLTGNIWVNADEIPGNGLDDDGNGFVDDVRGWDFAGSSYSSGIPDNNPADVNGHGTHISGTIAAVGNNGIGVIGLAWGARVMPVRCYDNATQSTYELLANGVVYAANNGADVINNSYGAVAVSYAMWDAMNYAHSLGVVLVVAAGNDNARTEGYAPASYPNVITVAASKVDDTKAIFSNWGSKVDVAAPGDDILSLRATGTSAPLPVGTEYERMNGTSMASPHAAAVAALILSLHPEFTQEQVRQALRASADDIGAPGPDDYFGYGRINAAAALTITEPLEAKITMPTEGGKAGSLGPLDIRGIARGPNFSYYILDCGAGESPTTWTVLRQDTAPLPGGEITMVQPNLPDGRSTLRLRTFDDSGRAFTDRVSFLVDYVTIAYPPGTADPGTAPQFRPGDSVVMHGDVWGPTFRRFSVEWARGIGPSNGWSNLGVTLRYGGTSTLYDEEIATWDTTGITEGGFYTLRLTVENDGFATVEQSLVYIDSDIMSPYWPQYLYPVPAPGSSLIPARDASGAVRLVMAAGGYWDSHPPIVLSFAADGSENIRSEWLNGGTDTQPAAADLDGNPGDEIVVGEGNQLRVLRPDLSTLTTLTPAQTVSFQYSHILLEDLNGDGQLEIIALGNAANAAYLYAWEINGQQLAPNFPIQVANLNASLRGARGVRCLAVDLDGNGCKELLVAEGDSATTCRLRAFNADGTAHTAWTSSGCTGYIVDMVSGDLDRDGSPDIAIGSLEGTDPSEGRVRLLAADGTAKPGSWPSTLGLYDAPKLAIADLDRDGLDEVVIASRDWLSARKTNGSAAAGFGCQGVGTVVAGDIDADGFPELIAERLDYPAGLELVAFRGNGTALKTWPIIGMNGTASTGGSVPVLGDFNNDGQVDIVSWYCLSTGGGFGDGAIMAVTPHLGEGTQKLDWPVNGHDARNTRTAVPPAGEPTVVILEPSGGATLSGSVILRADATDDTAVLGVRFRLDGVNLYQEITSPPYELVWDTTTATEGRHTLMALARDGDGNVRAAKITVYVSNDRVPPHLVAVTSPADGATVSGSITITADAADNIGIAGVRFKVDGANVGYEDTYPPYSVYWDTRTAGNGTHALTAIARDVSGNTATSAPVNVVVANDAVPPSVSVTAPIEGAQVSGTINVSADASDNVGVVGVQFKLDGANLGTEDTAAPYSVSWATAGSSNGPHTLRAVARDAAGNTATSAAVNVTVTNAVKINFQPASAPTYAGYLVDGGAVFGTRDAGYSYGWNLDNASHAYDRNSSRSPDQRYDTLLAMQTGGTYTWEIAVPNGTYSVHVVAGDANNYNSVYKINVEGVLTVNGTPTRSSRWKEGAATITVSDGRLTVTNAAGASNNKICFIDITPLP